MERSNLEKEDDKIYDFIVNSKLTVRDIETLRKDEKIWKRIFRRKFNPENKDWLDRVWKNLPCDNFMKIIAFVYQKKCNETGQIEFIKKSENLGLLLKPNDGEVVFFTVNNNVKRYLLEEYEIPGVTCGQRNALLQCSGPCAQIYCGESCQKKNHNKNCL